MPRCSAASQRTGCAVRCESRPKTAEPSPRPIRNATRMIVNEKIDEPISTASARVHMTCSVIAVAPDTAKPRQRHAPRRRRHRPRSGGSDAGRARVEVALGGRLVEQRVHASGRSAPRAGSGARAASAAASVRLNAAAVTLVQRRPKRGQEDEPREERARDGAEQVDRVQRADAQAHAPQLPGVLHEVPREDRQRRAHERRRHEQQARRRDEAQDREQRVAIAERRPQPAVERRDRTR